MTRRLVLAGADLEPGSLQLPGGAVRHVVQVLRSKVGDELLLVDGAGRCANAVIERLSPRAVTVRIVTVRTSRPPARPLLHLVQCLPKGSKLDEIVRRATELGVASIRPCLSKRSVARPPQDRAVRRLERWRRIAAEAARQCRRDHLPEVLPIVRYEEALAAVPEDAVGLVLYENERSRGLADLLDAGVEGAVVVVGPEGGLTATEVAAAVDRGFSTASLGPLVLRTETAAIAACAVAQHILGGLTPSERPERAGAGAGGAPGMSGGR